MFTPDQVNLFHDHKDLPEKLARRTQRSCPVDVDAESIAWDTFYDCLRRFDHSRGVPFRGFAATVISRVLRREAGRAIKRREKLEARQHVEADPCLLLTLVVNGVSANVALDLDLQVSTAPVQAAA